MVALTVTLEEDLWDDAAREAALRGLDVDWLLADALTERFTHWSRPPTGAGGPPDDPLPPAADPAVLALLSGQLMRAGLDGAARATLACARARARRPDQPRWTRALVHAMTDDIEGRADRLDHWRRAMDAGDRAIDRGLPHEAAVRFHEAAVVAHDAPIPQLLAVERLARAHLAAGDAPRAARAARRATVLAGARPDAQLSAALVQLAEAAEAVRGAHGAVQAMVTGLLALERGEPEHAAGYFELGADRARVDGESTYELRARGALATLRLAAGRGDAAADEAERAGALARSAAADELAALLDVLAVVGRLLTGCDPEPGGRS